MTTVLNFGECTLFVVERRLECQGRPVKIGGRALDLLVALARRKGEVVSARELMEYAWPKSVVTDSSLRVHLGELRKALNAASPNTHRLILNVPGRGYQLAVPPDPQTGRELTKASNSLPGNPLPNAQVFGREGAIRDALQLLESHAIVSLVGPGGMGKTTVANWILKVRTASGAETLWVDLSSLKCDELVASEVARAAGVPQSGSNAEGLVTQLRGRSDLLLVLDCCERVAKGAALLAEYVVRQLPSLRILVTSREPLRAEGERVLRLPPLEVRSVDGLDPMAPGPAVELFVARARVADVSLQLPQDLPLVEKICLSLDGIPLAIELAAAHLVGFGLDDLASLIASGFQLGRMGRRTASERHQTLEATFEWSYLLLENGERQALEWLAVFEGGASLQAILEVLSMTGQSPEEVAHNLARLVDKCLVKQITDESGSYYRMLDMTRVFAAKRLQIRGEVLVARTTHARHMLRAAAGAQFEGKGVSAAEWLGPRGPNLSNLRSALVWARTEPSTRSLAVALSVASAPILLALSMLEECARVCELALALIPPEARGSHEEETLLLAYRGGAMLATRGPVDECLSDMSAALAQAEDSNDTKTQALVMSGLFWLWIYRGEPSAAKRAANALCEVRGGDSSSTLMRDGMLAYASTFVGDQSDAMARLEDVQQRNRWHSQGQYMRIGSEPNVFYRVFTVKTHWLRGEVDKAIGLYRELIPSLQKPEHGLYHCWALNEVMIPMHCFIGDWSAARTAAQELSMAATRQTMAIRNQAAVCASMAIELLQGEGHLDDFLAAVDVLRKWRFASLLPWLDAVAAQHAAIRGKASLGLRILDQAISHANRTSSRWWLPELHRVRGVCNLKNKRERDPEKATQEFRLACEIAGNQQAFALQLSAAVEWGRSMPDGIGKEVQMQLESALTMAPEMSKHVLGAQARRMLDG